MNPETPDVAGFETRPPSSSAHLEREAELVGRAQAGDREAMQALVLDHQEAIARLLWRFARTRPDLDDLVQETFLRMVRGLPSFKAQQPFSHWLLRIASNVGRDSYRRTTVRKRWMVEPEAEGEAGVLPEAVDRSLNPAARAAANEVKAFLDQLPADERALLTLHHLEGWGLAQIAESFHWTLAATKIRAWRARNRLRALLEANPKPLLLRNPQTS